MVVSSSVSGVLRVGLAWALLGAAAGAAPADGPAAARRRAKPTLKPHPTKYYVLYTDLAAPAAQEAAARMTAMAEEYRRRTRGFAGTIRKRLPFALYRRREDYYADGGVPGSSGAYHPRLHRLMAVAEHGLDDRLWHVIQHEGFHQFADMVIGGSLPTWVNEGLAEYFGHGLWTGDGFVTGVVPPSRLKRLQGHLRSRRIVPFMEMLLMTADEWRAALAPGRDEHDRDPAGRNPSRATVNYDQAWSMVHFLVHGEAGKYRPGFSAMIRDVSRGGNWKHSFQRRLGRNVTAFQKRYTHFWLAQPAHPTWELYCKAVVQTLTSFLARSVSQGQPFESIDAFLREARGGRLRCHPAQHLPATLLNDALVRARRYSRWSLETAAGKLPKLILDTPQGRTFVGTFTCSAGKAADVQVAVSERRTPGE